MESYSFMPSSRRNCGDINRMLNRSYVIITLHYRYYSILYHYKTATVYGEGNAQSALNVVNKLLNRSESSYILI